MTIRLNGGKLSGTDGPYMETKEHLAGIYLLDVTDQDEAVRLAARIPAAWAGRIELRPVWEPAG